MGNLADQIKQVKKETEQLEDAAEKLAIVKEEVFDMKLDILSSAFGMLMTKVNESVDDWLKIQAENGQNNRKFADQIKQSIERVITAVAQQKIPEVKVNVDLAPIQSIASDISRQNETLIKLLNKLSMGDSGKSDELHRLIVAMISKQNMFLEREVQQFDYTKQLSAISESLNKTVETEKIEVLNIKRGEGNLITSVIPVYKKAK